MVIISFWLVVQLLFSLLNIFYLVAATSGGLLVSSCVYFEIGTLAFASWSIPVDHIDLKCSNDLHSNLGYPNVDYQKLLGYSKTTDSPNFFLYYLLQ